MDGNPGGYISADDTESSGTWFFSAPNKFLGELSTLYDKNIEFDLRQHSNMTNQYNHIGGDVIIEGNGLVIVFNTTDNPRFSLDKLQHSCKCGCRLVSK